MGEGLSGLLVGPVGSPTGLVVGWHSFNLILRGDRLALHFDDAVFLPSLAVLFFFSIPEGVGGLPDSTQFVG